MISSFPRAGVEMHIMLLLRRVTKRSAISFNTGASMAGVPTHRAWERLDFQVCYFKIHLNLSTMTKPPKEILLEHERFKLKAKSGGGLLSYEVWGYEEKGGNCCNPLQPGLHQPFNLPS